MNKILYNIFVVFFTLIFLPIRKFWIVFVLYAIYLLYTSDTFVIQYFLLHILGMHIGILLYIAMKHLIIDIYKMIKEMNN